MIAPDIIRTLVDRFGTNLDQLRSAAYNETQIRREYLDPLFLALGWDVDNRQGFALPYREVIHEDSIVVAGGTKAPDYSFRIGGMRKFFVEAKKPSVNLKDDVSPAFQLRRYAWSAKLPLSILSDFEEFAVYDCRNRPSRTDKASNSRITYFTFTDIVDKWEEIYSVFSKEAVLHGSFDKYAEAKKKKGTADVDDVFLEEIENWRSLLARNIALRNPKLTQAELNFAVQRTVDRIIFLRICEDRGIETYGTLQELASKERTYKRLVDLFCQADDKYNSGLFHFQQEKDRSESLDTFTLDLKIDDKVVMDIIGGLYYPESPYEFSVLPADILGSVYERFLGKVIRLTKGHQAKIEEKPEVRKAGGVYYTPTYIVDYIVKNTVGKLVEGKAPKEVSSLRVLDPACGSGSFLIGAYQYLLDWHRDWYAAHEPEKLATTKNPPVYLAPGGEWKLATIERKRILLNNIYGVDIDTQAVEVTKLSLLLKVLEGENEQTINAQLKMFHERALPDLGKNIKCGNSLIGPDFFDDQLIVDAEERMRINAFDWKSEFKEIMARGGFDVVIGNPPYVRIQVMKEWAPQEVEFYKTKYSSAAVGNYDLYVVVVERGLSLLNDQGSLGFILPHKFFNAQYGEALRGLLKAGQHLSRIVHFGDEQVFEGASTYTCLMFLSKAVSAQTQVVRVDDLDAWRRDGSARVGVISTETIQTNEWSFAVGEEQSLLEKLSGEKVKLQNVTDRIFQGVKTSADKIYIVDELGRQGKRIHIFSRQRNADYWVEAKLFHPLVKGGDSRRYKLTRTDRRILFPYGGHGSSDIGLIPMSFMKEHFPLTWSYLLDNKDYLQNREDGKMIGDRWYGYVYPKALDVMSLPKIFTPDIASRASYSLDESGDIFFTGGAAGGYGILVSKDFDRRYILGLLNSRLLEWIVYRTATQMRGGYFSFESRFIKDLPIHVPKLDMPEERSRYDHVIRMVESMLQLNKDLPEAKTDHERTALQRQIDATDRQIDALVYELYGLTEEEIGIVIEAKQRTEGRRNE